MAEHSYARLRSPDLAEIESIAAEAFQALPSEFRDLCGNLVIAVEDFATDEVLDDMSIKDPFELMGLFQGIGLTEDGAVGITGQLPNMVFLYRRPILDYWAEHDETLGHVVTHVLVHEIGHHFGLSDADMAEIERSVP